MENKGNAVGLAVIPVIVVTAIWLIVGGVVPLFIKGPNKRSMIFDTSQILMPLNSQKRPFKSGEIQCECNVSDILYLV